MARFVKSDSDEDDFFPDFANDGLNGRYDDKFQPSDFGSRESNGGQSLSVERANEAVPLIHDILSTWIKRDFKTTEEFLKSFGLRNEDFSLVKTASSETKNVVHKDNLFGDVTNNLVTLGPNLARLFDPLIPENLFFHKTFKTKEWGNLDIHSFRALQYLEFNKLHPSVAHQMVDISDEKLIELKETLDPAPFLAPYIATEDDIKNYRQLLNERFLLLEKNFKRTYPKGYKGQQFDRDQVIGNVSKSLDLNPWELFAYVPLNKRRVEGHSINPSDPQQTSRPVYLALDPVDIVRNLTNALFWDDEQEEDEEEERLKFFDLANNVLCKKIGYDIEVGILNGPNISIGEIYRYKRKSLNQTIFNVSKTTKCDTGAIENNKLTSGNFGKKLNRYYGFNDAICLKLEEKFSLRVADIKKQKREENFLKRLNALNERSDDQNSPGMLFRKFRLQTLKASLDDIKTILGIERRAAICVKEIRSTISLKDLKAVTQHYKIPEKRSRCFGNWKKPSFPDRKIHPGIKGRQSHYLQERKQTMT